MSTAMSAMRRYLIRDAATQFIRDQGVPCGKTSLAELASDGRGPRYALINGRAAYTEMDLIAWIEEQATRPTSRNPRRGRTGAVA
jgi:hypothetical protein